MKLKLLDKFFFFDRGLSPPAALRRNIWCLFDLCRWLRRRETLWLTTPHTSVLRCTLTSGANDVTVATTSSFKHFFSIWTPSCFHVNQPLLRQKSYCTSQVFLTRSANHCNSNVTTCQRRYRGGFLLPRHYDDTQAHVTVRLATVQTNNLRLANTFPSNPSSLLPWWASTKLPRRRVVCTGRNNVAGVNKRQ